MDPLTLDYSQYTAGNFPYRVVQMPGPANAMGQVKFMFPNRHAVYLHDTPSRELFSRSQRAFSAGCIRVKNPLELARRLLDDPDNWSAQQIQDLLDSGDPQQVARVQRPIDVLLMYWTISPTGGDRTASACRYSGRWSVSKSAQGSEWSFRRRSSIGRYRSRSVQV